MAGCICCKCSIYIKAQNFQTWSWKWIGTEFEDITFFTDCDTFARKSKVGKK